MVIKSAKLLTKSGAPAMPYIRAEMARLKKQIQEVKMLLPIEIEKLGLRAGKLMAERVRRMTKREGATGELAVALEESMHFKKYGTSSYQVVMTTAGLPDYWAMINYGGFVSPKYVYGFWSDGERSDYTKRGGTGKGTFEADGQGFLMMPRKPIKGFHYIFYAYQRIITEMRSGKFTRKVMPSTK